MENFKKVLQDLELAVSIEFNKLIDEKQTIDFAKKLIDEEEGIENESFDEIMNERDLYICLPTIEVRNDMTGNVFDVHVLSITNRGIKVVEMDSTDCSHIIKFSDIASVNDKIELLDNIINY